MMSDCDTLLMVGSSFPYSEFLPKEGQARGVQIDIDGRMLSIRYPMEVSLVGDSRETLRALLPLLDHKGDRGWRKQIEDAVARWWTVLEARAKNPADPINPQWVFWELSPRLPDGCIIAADSGSSADWFARDLKLRRGMMASLSGNLATMGSGVPYAVAADILLTGKHITAAEALHYGLVSYLVPDGTALDKAREVAATVAANGPLAVEAILQTLRATEHMSEEEAFAFEQPIGMAVMASADSKEGPKAFAEKRTPNFQRK